ncbi:MAG: hypothetical protein LKJ88_08625 [Bacilli bacterium]|jgi:hypothetical protein|nr:hypothetical protein [Bacilli bacterium]
MKKGMKASKRLGRLRATYLLGIFMRNVPEEEFNKTMNNFALAITLDNALVIPSLNEEDHYVADLKQGELELIIEYKDRPAKDFFDYVKKTSDENMKKHHFKPEE